MAVPGKAPGAIGPGQAAVFGPTSMTDTSRLGGAPRDGDFAQLLERASQPEAHRMHARVAPASALKARGGADTAAFGQTARPPSATGQAHDPLPPHAHETTPVIRPAETTPASSGTLDLAEVGTRASTVLKRWSARPLKERIVTGLIALGVVWFVLNLLASLVTSADDHLGLLAVAALFIFFVLRQRAGHRSSR